VEYSEIKQSGDVDLVRDFTYTKPSLSLTYSPSDKTQWRLRIEKEVGQLDFNDFVSAANFQDDDLAAGNPELEPEQTWVLEVTYERRFGAIGVIEIAPFFHMIEDVEDVVPIADLYEAPGNIGDGKRWGVDTNLTMGLDLIGVKNARLDISYSWQDSSATDPVTGRDRPLSWEEAWEYDISLRKDFPKARTSIGIGYEDSDEHVRYGLDEITSSYYSSGLSTFGEVTLGKGYKLRFDAFNITGIGGKRDRSVYAGSRAAAPLQFIESRRRKDDPYYRLTLSGTF
jgi:hypothetical protein